MRSIVLDMCKIWSYRAATSSALPHFVFPPVATKQHPPAFYEHLHADLIYSRCAPAKHHPSLEKAVGAQIRMATWTSGVCPSGRCFNPRRLIPQSCPAVLALKRITAQRDVTDKTRQMDLKRWIFQLLASRYCKSKVTRFCFCGRSIFEQSPKSVLCIVKWGNVV